MEEQRTQQIIVPTQASILTRLQAAASNQQRAEKKQCGPLGITKHVEICRTSMDWIKLIPVKF